MPFFLRMKTQKQPERKKRTDIRMYRAGRGISPALWDHSDMTFAVVGSSKYISLFMS